MCHLDYYNNCQYTATANFINKPFNLKLLADIEPIKQNIPSLPTISNDLNFQKNAPTIEMKLWFVLDLMNK